MHALKTIAALLLAVSASAHDCVPFFFQAVPRDREYYYASASAPTADQARSAAVESLLITAGYTTGYEQDDAARCDGISYVLVRIEKSKADAYVTKDMAAKRKAAALEPKVNMLRGRVDDHDTRIASADRRLAAIEATPAPTIIMNVDPTRPVDPPTREQLAFYEKLQPALRLSLGAVYTNRAKPEDVGNVVATYNTMHDGTRLKAFCDLSLHHGYDVIENNPGLKVWLNRECQNGAR